jgi:hypothetical protein
MIPKKNIHAHVRSQRTIVDVGYIVCTRTAGTTMSLVNYFWNQSRYSQFTEARKTVRKIALVRFLNYCYSSFKVTSLAWLSVPTDYVAKE